MKSSFFNLVSRLKAKTPHSSRRWLPAAAALFLLTAAAAAMGWLALQERGRAERTVQMLLHDYASFVSDKLRSRSSDHYQSCSGLRIAPQGSGDTSDVPSPFAHIRAWSRGEEPEFSRGREWVRYYFSFDASSGGLRFEGGQAPGAEEQAQLLQALGNIPTCSANQTLTWPSLNLAGLGHDASMADPPSAGRDGEGSATTSGAAREATPADGREPAGNLQVARTPSWGVLLQTDGLGGIKRAFGFAVSQPLLADHLMAGLLSPQSECGCSQLLPESLSEIENIGTAASVVVRDAAGKVALSSGPIPEGISPESLVRTPLGSELPFPGWTVEVAIRPQVIEGLLPSGGLPLWALVLLGTVVAAAALLGARSLRRSEELLRLQENFVSNVSHELKTPLSKIRLFNELLDPERGEPRKAARYRGVIDRECRRLSLLVDNVLRFSEGGPGVPPQHLRRIRMSRVAERAQETFRAANDPQRERFVLQCSGHGEVEGDEALLQQVIMNLLDNAVKYSPPGSPIFLRLSEEAGRVLVEVEDRGPGVPPDQRRRIFDEFYRIEGDDDQSAAGSGLGLALVRRHVESHGGRVEMRPAQEGGSVFAVSFPAAPPAGAAGGASESGQGTSPGSSTSSVPSLAHLSTSAGREHDGEKDFTPSQSSA